MAVVMPAYNEEAIGDFVREICDEISPRVRRLSVVVVDDASRTPVQHAVVRRRDCSIEVLRHLENQGHGPSVLDAYRAGLATDADVVVHADGDGQVDPASLLEIIGVASAHAIAIGQRTGRADPWFRRLLTWMAGRCLAGRGRLTDSNSPVRAFRADVLHQVMTRLPASAVVPHLLMNVVLADLDLLPRTVAIKDRPRRGETVIGTTWRPRRLHTLPPAGLTAFAARAVLEVLGFRLRGVARGAAEPDVRLAA
ncbi:MAG: glycosyltransferase [Actinobacteria bacterium]|nr:glycosyltransferase [Actinomycetota bacterium]